MRFKLIVLALSLYWLAAGLFILSGTDGTRAAGQPKATIAVRCDLTLSDDDNEIQKFVKFLSECDESKIPLTLFIVPPHEGHGGKAASAISPFVKRGSVEIGLHGFDHQQVPPPWWMKLHGLETEFAGMSINEQKDKIERGSRRLHELFGVDIKSFAPPFNTYDENTESALEGFESVSASYRLDGYVPETPKRLFPLHADRLEDLYSIYDSATAEDRIRIFLFFHFRDLKNPALAVRQFVLFRERHHAEFVTFSCARDEEVRKIDSEKFAVISVMQVARSLLDLPVIRELEGGISRRLELGGLFSAEYYRRARGLAIEVILLFGITGALAAFSAGVRRLKYRSWLVTIVLAMAAYFVTPGFSYKELYVLLLAVMFSAGCTINVSNSTGSAFQSDLETRIPI